MVLGLAVNEAVGAGAGGGGDVGGAEATFFLMPLKTRGWEGVFADSAILLFDSEMMPGECRRPSGKSGKNGSFHCSGPLQRQALCSVSLDMAQNGVRQTQDRSHHDSQHKAAHEYQQNIAERPIAAAGAVLCVFRYGSERRTPDSRSESSRFPAQSGPRISRSQEHRAGE